jgi:hypothetical protein
LIDAALKERPLVDRAYLMDAQVHAQIVGMRRTLVVVEGAMREQGVSYDVAQRVLAESVRIPFDQYVEMEERRMGVARALSRAFNVPEEVIYGAGTMVLPEEDETS